MTRYFPLILAAIATVALAGCGGSSAADNKADWITDPAEAMQQTKALGKPVLIEFAGSDWSPICQRVQKDVLDTPQFKDFSDQYLVLYLADFPRNSTLDPRIAAQNAQLAKNCGVDNYPTFYLVGADGKPLGKFVGAMPVESFLDQLRKLVPGASGNATDTSNTTAPANATAGK
jgi:thioredoxin-related protein